MEILNLKVHEFNEETNSLIVSFSTNDSIKTPDEYTRYSFVPSIYSDEQPATASLYNIAQQGVSVARDQNQKDLLQLDQTKLEYYRSIVGQTFQYNISTDPDIDTSDLSTIIVPGQ